MHRFFFFVLFFPWVFFSFSNLHSHMLAKLNQWWEQWAIAEAREGSGRLGEWMGFQKPRLKLGHSNLVVENKHTNSSELLLLLLLHSTREWERPIQAAPLPIVCPLLDFCSVSLSPLFHSAIFSEPPNLVSLPLTDCMVLWPGQECLYSIISFCIPFEPLFSPSSRKWLPSKAP